MPVETQPVDVSNIPQVNGSIFELNNQNYFLPSGASYAVPIFFETATDPSRVTLSQMEAIAQMMTIFNSQVQTCNYKTKLCRFTTITIDPNTGESITSCPFGERCTYAHSAQELMPSLEGILALEREARFLQSQAQVQAQKGKRRTGRNRAKPVSTTTSNTLFDFVQEKI